MSRFVITSFLIFTAIACQHTQLPAPSDIQADVPLSVDEAATVLQLEDRREFDPAIASEWIENRSFYHRKRMALALGRIGAATFIDVDGDGQRDPDEKMAGVDLLSTLTGDPNDAVRLTAAFSLGEIGDPAGIDALLMMARDDAHAGVRAEAIEALSKLAENVAVEDYATFTEPDQPAGVRRNAIRFLFRFDGDAPLALASRFLDDPSVDVRRAATYVMSRRAYPSAFETLVDSLDDEDLLTRSYAARGLDRIGDPRALDPLLVSVLDVHPWVRTNALRAIASIAAANPEPFRSWASAETLIPVLTTADDPDPGTKATAIETLAVFAPLIPSAKSALVELAAEEEPAFRESATRALARAFSDDQSLLDALLETDSRQTRIIVLQETSGAATGPALRARYADDPDPSVRAAVVSAVPDESATSEETLILRLLEDPDPIVRASAIDRAAKLERTRARSTAVSLEKQARTDELNDARLSAIAVIAELSAKESEQRFRELLTDSDPVVRRVAADAIESFGFLRPQYTPIDTGRTIDWYRDVASWARDPHSAVIETARGPIEIILLTEDAPITAKNFADLAASGYFDGTSFMRVVPNFVIQGGDPRNDMSGGPGYAIRDEINLQKYSRGAVGMALSGPDTGGSQFFITHSPQHHLDGGYTIFGRVTDGMTGAVDQMRRGDAVRTIRVDAAIETTEQAVSDSARDPLPLVIGEVTPEMTLDELPEYRVRMHSYEPDPTVVSMMAPLITPEDRIEVYLGTWCRDSQRELPHFYKILSELRSSHDVELPIEYIAVDRSKRQPSELVEGRSIELVPTFIVYRGDEELGRVVEKPLSLLEDDLLTIFAGGGR